MARDEEPASKVRSMGRRRAACLVKNGKPGIAACWAGYGIDVAGHHLTDGVLAS